MQVLIYLFLPNILTNMFQFNNFVVDVHRVEFELIFAGEL
jgi:hypothetical protein